MWKLGTFDIKGKVVLAPMAGITSEGYRKYLNTFGVDVCVSEMVSDMGLIYQNKETESYVKYQKDGVLTGVQLFGAKPENLAKAARRAIEINPDIDFFDVNMGCPVPKVTKTGAGSALMLNPKLCGEIVKAIKKATNKPVTAKIRLGYNEVNFLEVINALENSGVDAIAVHARTRKELYAGEPHYVLLKDLRKKMNHPIGPVVEGFTPTVDQREIFRMALAEAVDEAESLHAVAAGHVLGLVAVAVDVEIFPGVDDGVPLFALEIGAVVEGREAPDGEVGPLDDVDGAEMQCGSS